MSTNLIFSNDAPLSENQRLFNEYLRQIESLQQKLDREKIRLELLKKEFHKDIIQLFEQLSEERIALAMLFHQATYDFKYSSSQLEIFGDVIVYLFEQAFQSLEATEDQEIIYQQWKGQSFSKVQAQDIAQLMDKIAEELLYQHGIYINTIEYESTPEDYVRFRNDVSLLLQHQGQKKQKKSKKQLKEEVAKQEEIALQQRSIRSIYISLAKVLHPDVQHEHLDSDVQEEWMKKVTAAYQSKDLHTLLVLEKEWIDQQNSHLNQLNEDQLSVYLLSLKERIKHLENEIKDLYKSPIYEEIHHLIHMNEKKAMQKIKSERSDIKNVIQTFKHNLQYLKQQYSKKEIQDAVNQFHHLI